MSVLKIGTTDVSNFVKNLKTGYETLVSEDSGRNANGDTVIDIINKKVKLYVTFRPMNSTEMATLLSAIDGYVVSVTYRDPKTNTDKTINCYTGTPEPDYYYIHNDKVMYKELSFNFIQL